MRRLVLLFSLVSSGLVFAPGTSATRSVSDRLIGAWRLVSVETKRANGEIIHPFYGEHPQGLLIYDRSGRVIVEIVSDPEPSVPPKRRPEMRRTLGDGTCRKLTMLAAVEPVNPEPDQQPAKESQPGKNWQT